MRSTNPSTYQQVPLPLAKTDLWNQLPEAKKTQCRQLLMQLLQSVGQPREATQQRSSDEREN